MEVFLQLMASQSGSLSVCLSVSQFQRSACFTTQYQSAFSLEYGHFVASLKGFRRIKVMFSVYKRNQVLSPFWRRISQRCSEALLAFIGGKIKCFRMLQKWYTYLPLGFIPLRVSNEAVIVLIMKTVLISHRLITCAGGSVCKYLAVSMFVGQDCKVWRHTTH